MVPVRLTFSPFARMDQTELLSTDLIADCILFIFAALRWNTAYFSKKSRWVTSRGKIAKHYLANGFVTDALCSFPFDWCFLNPKP
ncbi:hypothetical protein T484DRAFT_2424125 [Baffinella frigidus]|nr:hypothetical protein T484DRAFT_2424125 [Cryptophyta sp. CCMP2293]